MIRCGDAANVAAAGTAGRTVGRKVVRIGSGIGMVLVASAWLAGCADDPSDLRPTTPAGAPADAAADDVATGISVEVQALDNTFREAELSIEVGTEVVFTNVGRNEHNVIPEPGGIQGWGVGEDLFAPGDVYAHVFTEPGVYEYVCTIHGVKRKGMVGTITVTG